ncbi:hypothetical protein Rhe02_68160 [Rhizocola hellebori]|uniref:non-specific serine/threonine protein kinase n=1 Tax=Rhizocola hellebori TaxID=1392758 RepID=A0A8J3QFH6_9ACTN|nr:serine/threonine-protein kinase [Rhizocola hellebori]GIH08749.1 hypothetical protein Rhe02_68160 [Rhizocola hellebori]
MNWTVPGYYEIKELGRGASGRVVLAEHVGTGMKVAIKYLAAHLARDPEFVSAFRTEARILSEVEDPQIACLYEYIEGPDGAAIVMELVDGVALRAMIKAHGPTEPTSALLVLKGSLLGLAAAHQRGVVHRDYKPENVLVNQEGQSKLADFGIAARAGRQGVHAGTPSYMAPEQWAGAPASPSTDIYAATATFFECLVGVPPYRSPGDLLGLRKQHEEAPIPIDAVPEPVRGLVRRGLAKKVEHRPKDAATFLYELEQVAGAGYGPEWEEEGRSALARRAALLLLLFPLAGLAAGGTGAAKTVIGWSNRSLNMLLAGGVTLALLIAGGLGWYFTHDSQNLPPVALIQSPSPTPDTSPSPSLTPSPTAEPSPTASPSPLPSLSPSPSTKPSPKVSSPPPPPAPVVLSISSPNPNDPNDYCWLADNHTTCSQFPQGNYQPRIIIKVDTNTTNSFTLNLRFVQVYTNKAGEFEDTGRTGLPPITQSVVVPAGKTSNVLTITGADLRTYWSSQFCRDATLNPRIKLTITASIPGPGSSADYITDAACVIG